MRKNFGLLAVLMLFTFVLQSCQKDDVKDLATYMDLKEKSLEVNYTAQSVDIRLLGDAVPEVISNNDWIRTSIVKKGGDSYLRISIDQNDDMESDRQGTIEIHISGLDQTITIIQKFRTAILIDNKIICLTSQKQTFSIPVKSNTQYDIIISGEDTDWIKQESQAGTKSITQQDISFSVSENEAYVTRQAYIYFSAANNEDADTILVIQDEGFQSLRKALKNDSNCSIFYEALSLTGLADTLTNYIDARYPGVSEDSTLAYLQEKGNTPHSFSTSYEYMYPVWPDKRTFKYTVFVVTDATLKKKYSIKSVDELRQFAQTVYPEGKSLPDTDLGSSLNMLMSYHILPYGMPYDQLNTSTPDIVGNYGLWNEYDIEDFYETMLPHSIMRISTARVNAYNVTGIYINRKGTQKNGIEIPGAKITAPGEYVGDINNTADNGAYHYIDNILKYDSETRWSALNIRMRVMANTFSPDFINSGARGRSASSGTRADQSMFGFLKGFCKNVYWTDETQFYVRPRFKTFGVFNGEETFLNGNYDIAYKLPSVPHDGIYEIRTGVTKATVIYNANNPSYRTQFYIYESEGQVPNTEITSWDWVAQGDVIDRTVNVTDPALGWVSDDDSRYDGLSDAKKHEAILANDQQFREHGYMKSMDSYFPNSSYSSLRQQWGSYRKIITQVYLKANGDYYIRIKNADNDPRSFFYFNYLELVPEDVYSNPDVPEDWH